MKSRLVFDKKDLIGAWVANEVEQTASWGSFYAMGIMRGKEVLAGVVFNNFNSCNVTAHIAVKRFTKLFPELIKHAFFYAFKQNNLLRVTGLVESDNKKSLALNKHIGFEKETIMKKAGAKGQDIIVLVMWPENCRWVN